MANSCQMILLHACLGMLGAIALFSLIALAYQPMKRAAERVRKAGPLNMLLALVTVAALVAYGGTKPEPAVPTPEDAFFRVTPYVQHPSTNAMSILWVVDRNAWGMLEVWKAGERYSSQFHDVRPREATELGYFGYSHPKQYLPASTQWLCQYRLTDLEPDTEYGYRVYYGNGESYTSSFRTAPMEFRPVHFVAYSDSETQPSSTGDRVVWENYAVDHDTTPNSSRRYYIDQTDGYASNICTMVASKPDFFVIAGDLAEKGSDQTHWDEFWRHNAGELNDPAGSIPILASPGNHEYHGYYAADDYGERGMRKFLAYFEFEPNGADVDDDQQERFHRLDYGPVAVIFIDANNGQDYYSDSTSDMVNRENGTPNMQDTTQPLFRDRCRAPDFNPGSAQYRWLEEQLADAQTNKLFTFLVCHQCPFSVGYHGRLNGEKGTESSAEYLSGAATRCLTNLVFKYGVDAWLCGHDELYEHSRLTGMETLPDGTMRRHELNVYDVGMGGDGLRGCNRTGRPNPYEVYRAHVDAPEVYDANGTLISGGKHYGHMDVNVTTNAEGVWTATLTPTYVFVSSNTVTGKISFERRTYPDVVVVTNAPQEQAEEPIVPEHLWYANPQAAVLAENLPGETGSYVSAFHGQGQGEYLGLTYSTNPLQFDLFRVNGTNEPVTVTSVPAANATTPGFRGVAISKALGVALTLAYDKTTTMYAFPLSGGDPVAVTKPNTHSFDSAAFSPDGSYIFSNSLNGESSNQYYVKWAVSNGGATLTKVGSISVGGRGRNLAYARINGRDLVFGMVDTGKVVVLDMTSDNASAWTVTDLVTGLPNHSYGSLCVSGVNTAGETPHLTVATSTNNGATKADVLNVYKLTVPPSGAVTASRVKSFDEDAMTAAGFGDISDANRYGNTVYVTDDNTTIYFARPDGRLYAYTTREAFTVSVEGRDVVHYYGDSVTFTAPEPWDADGMQVVTLGTTYTAPVVTNEFTVTVTNNIRFAWDLFLTNWWFETAGTLNGSILAPDAGWMAGGTNFILAATPDEHYHFVCWTGDTEGCTETDGALEVTMDRPRAIGAEFAIDTFTVTFEAGAHGTLSGATEQVIDYGATAAVPGVMTDAGYAFMGWSGDVAAPVVSNATFTAQYVTIPYAITYTGLKGAANLNPATYTIEDAVTFAEPGEVYGWVFKGWTPASIALGSTGEVEVTANWERQKFDVTVNGETRQYSYEDEVTFTAPGPCDTNGMQVVTLGTTFTTPVVTNEFTVMVTNSIEFSWDILATNWWLEVAEPQNGAVEVRDGEGAAVAHPCWVADGEVLTLVAVPAERYRLAGWTGTTDGCTAMDNTLLVAMDRPRMIGAEFELDITLAQAVNAEDLEWATGGAANWKSEWAADASDGLHDARCGAIPNGTNAWIAAVVDGPGTIAFKWKSALASRNTKYQFMVDGEVKGMLTGTNGWTATSAMVLGGSTHEVKWRLLTGRSGADRGDMVALDEVSWTPATPPTLAEALNTNLVWTTDGDVPWRAVPRDSLLNERDAWAAVDGLGDNGTAAVQTRVYGSGVLVFDWAISCEEDYDWIELTVDGEVREYLTGDRDWTTTAIAIEGSEWHTVRWEYVKDEMDDASFAGENAARLDNVIWRSDDVPPPAATQTTPVPVPYAELERRFSAYLEQSGGDYEAAAHMTGRNGCPIWQSYLAGLDPQTESSRFMARIAIVGGKPAVTWEPNTPELRATRIYRKLGKRDIGDPSEEWTEVKDGDEAGYNFFKVTVELP